MLLISFLMLVGVFIYLTSVGVPVSEAACIFICPGWILIAGIVHVQKVVTSKDKMKEVNLDCDNKAFELRPCPVCGGKAKLCGEGLAKSVFEDCDEHIFFTDFDGYAVSCENCTNATKHYRKAEDAVGAWNNCGTDSDHSSTFKRVEESPNNT